MLPLLKRHEIQVMAKTGLPVVRIAELSGVPKRSDHLGAPGVRLPDGAASGRAGLVESGLKGGYLSTQLLGDDESVGERGGGVRRHREERPRGVRLSILVCRLALETFGEWIRLSPVT
jgi:hypothetical protein